MAPTRSGVPAGSTGCAPSDLLARGSGVASRLAIDFEAHLAQKAHDPLARGAERLGERVRELPPLSAFGRGTSHEGAGRGPVGMS